MIIHSVTLSAHDVLDSMWGAGEALIICGRCGAQRNLRGDHNCWCHHCRLHHTTNKRPHLITTGQPLHTFSQWLPWLPLERGFGNSMLPICKLRHRELVQEHTACMWQSWIQTKENHTFSDTLARAPLFPVSRDLVEHQGVPGGLRSLPPPRHGLCSTIPSTFPS